MGFMAWIFRLCCEKRVRNAIHMATEHLLIVGGVRADVRFLIKSRLLVSGGHNGMLGCSVMGLSNVLIHLFMMLNEMVFLALMVGYVSVRRRVRPVMRVRVCVSIIVRTIVGVFTIWVVVMCKVITTIGCMFIAIAAVRVLAMMLLLKNIVVLV